MLQSRAYRLLTYLFSLALSITATNLLAADTPTKPAGQSQALAVSEKPSAEAAIRQALTKKVSLWYHEVPLRNVALDLEAKLGVPVRLDTAALKEAGITEDSPVTFKFSNVSARAAISLMCRDLQLTTITAYEVLLITSPAEAESFSVVKVYDLSDFANGDDGSDDDQPDLHSLADLITNCVATKAWQDNGGSGTIQSFASPGIRAMVVTQNRDVLCQIDEVLEQLRSVRHARKVDGKASSQPKADRHDAPQQLPATEGQVGPKISAAEKAIRQALEKPINVHVKATPLSEALQELAKAVTVPIVLDKKAKSEIDSTATVTLNTSDRALQSILDELVRPLNLAWTYHDESLLITSVSESESDEMQKLARVYNLSDFPAYRNRRGEGIPDYEKMIDTITNAVSPKTWQDNGGNCTIAKFDKAGIQGIVVSQNWQNHLQIELLLERLRKLRGRALTADDIKRLPPEPGPTVTSAADQATLPALGEEWHQPPKPLEADPRRDSIVEANNQFAFDLHRKLSGDNRFFSPASAATAVAMVYAGARGKTAEEIAKVLHFTLPQEDVAPAFQSLLVTLPAANHPGCQLMAANRLWGQKGYGFLEPFLTTTRERFGGGLAEVEFATPGPTCDLINAWADQNTAGRIKQIVNPSLITPQLRLIVTNAVYFKGQWAEPFEAAATKKGLFFSGDDRIDVPLMHQTARCLYGTFDNVKVLEKPYRRGEISMMILLPKKDPQALADLEQLLSAEKVKEWSAKLSSQLVDVTLPKFKLETNIPLAEALSSLGMPRVFDRGKADLTGINGGKDPLWIDWMLQQAFIKIDEEGTEAAAVTGGGLFGGMAPRPVVFRADHPFIFLIRDTRTGYILFLGRLVKPSA